MKNTTKFLLTNPSSNDEVIPMVIHRIVEKGSQANFHLEEGEHIIEIMQSDLEKMDIRLGDTVNFLGEDCKGVDISKRPLDAVAFSLPDGEEGEEEQKIKAKRKTR